MLIPQGFLGSGGGFLGGGGGFLGGSVPRTWGGDSMRAEKGDESGYVPRMKTETISDQRKRLVWGLSVVLLSVGCAQKEEGTTDVFIDSLGVPHIFARTDADAMFASGYVMAKARLFQLEMVRRQGRGLQSEILGEKSLRTDLLARTMAFARHGEASRKRMQETFPTEAKLIESFVRGINRYIDEVLLGTAPRPKEMTDEGLSFLPTKWTDDDPYIIGKLLSFGMSSSFDSELLATLLPKLAPTFPADFPLSMPTRQAFTMPDAKPQPLAGVSRAGGRRPQPGATSDRMDEQHRQQALDALSKWERLSPDLGSNNWAVAGRTTANGMPMLAGDPHQPFGSPIRFFVQHVNSEDQGGSLDVMGFGFAGTPGVQLGHNRRVAWTATTNFADVMDLWAVPVPVEDRIAMFGKTFAVETRLENIRVREEGKGVPTGEGGGDVRGYQIVDVPGVGVLLPDDVLQMPRVLLTSGQILFAWTGLGPTPEAAMYLGLDRSGSLAEWENAARRLEVGAVNLIAADAKNIRYRVHAKVPDRSDAVKKGGTPWKLMDGKDPLSMWSGVYLSEDKLPSAKDPARGFLATANNEPFGFTSDGDMKTDPYYYGYFYDPGDRAARIDAELSRLVARGGISHADFVALQQDARSTLAEDLLPPLKEAVEAIGTDPTLAEYVPRREELVAMEKRLAAWDKQMRRESSDAVMFFGFAHVATVRALSGTLGPMLPKLFEFEPAYAYKPLRLALRQVKGTESILGQDRRLVLVSALAQTADWLTQRFGSVFPTRDKPYRWQDVHGATFDHLLSGKWNAGVFPVDGSVGTVNVSSSAMSDGKGQIKQTWTAKQGSLYRMIVSFDEQGTPTATVNFPRGNFGDPDSPFFQNTHANWLVGQHEKLPFSRMDIETHAVQTWQVPRDTQAAREAR